MHINRISIIIILCLFYSVSFSQKNNFELQGTIKNITIEQGKIWVLNYNYNENIKSYSLDSTTVPIINNQFVFKGYMPHPHGFDGVYGESENKKIRIRTLPFFVDSGIIKIECYYDSTDRTIPKIIGSKTDDEYRNLFLPHYSLAQKLVDSFLVKIYITNYKMYGNKIPDSIQQITDKLDLAATKEKFQSLLSYMNNNKNSYIPIFPISFFISNIKNQYQFDLAKQLLYKLTPLLKNTVIADSSYKILKNKDPKKLNNILANLILKDTSDADSKLKLTATKFTVLDFWFSACNPCMKQLPELTRIYNSYKTKGFSVIGISVDANKKDWIHSINSHATGWKHLIDYSGNKTSKYLTGYPTYILMDENKKIIKFKISLAELEGFLHKNL
jgi:thiol-disulfide isomerase/thioredoxin